MHETRFINEIIAVLKQKLDKDTVPGKVRVNVRLSPFSHVAPESLQESLRELIKGENFKEVWLNVMPLELPLECNSCKRSAVVTRKIFGCPYCGSADISLQMEREFFVESIEIG